MEVDGTAMPAAALSQCRLLIDGDLFRPLRRRGELARIVPVLV
jgi:hypothetical protein